MVGSGANFIVDLLGYLTGAVLYVMLVAMVWRERASEGKSFLSRRGRLPLLTGVCGLAWNLGGLSSYAMQIVNDRPVPPLFTAVAFAALGFLPAVVVHSLLEGRATAAGRALVKPAIAAAYSLSALAALMHLANALRGVAVPSRAALWMLAAGFTALTASLLVVTRHQPIGRRGIWVAALAVFAIWALHFGRHVGNESWWVELAGHHASLPLALAILHQDYRFALADLFLKNAIAILLLMGVSLALFSGAVMPLLSTSRNAPGFDARVIAVCVALWMATALVYPWLRRFAATVVDRVVLRRPNYERRLTEAAGALDGAQFEEQVIAEVSALLKDTIGASDVHQIDDPLPERDPRPVIAGQDVRTVVSDASIAVLVRLRTVEAPHAALACGPLAGGRRLLSDDLHFIGGVARMASRRLDSLRVAQERLARNLREQQMQQLATESELRALRAQLNPHFLFNTLTTIGHLIQSAPPRALETLLRLTSVLRGVLRGSSREFVTLGEEIDLLTAYLEIERARFEERLRVSIDVPAALRFCRVPTLLLQPLVENAVRHGLAPQAAGGILRVLATARDGWLQVVVQDTGVGFEPARQTGRGGVGLQNVSQRLQVHYQGRAVLNIRSAFGQGTTITVTLPLAHSPRGQQRTPPAPTARVG